ncbi:hypothetical protein, partial [Pseudomonas sp. LRF_L74]|uniref:hypothetical protein n=1 Tax=Pseudomonas sp. LRF_L74 TaxID=3369422 RepID=UPI003F5FDE4C
LRISRLASYKNWLRRGRDETATDPRASPVSRCKSQVGAKGGATCDSPPLAIRYRLAQASRLYPAENRHE